MERGWLIEHESSSTAEPEYLYLDERGYVDWTKDNNLALRFARKQDAEMMTLCLESKQHRICEHSWG